MPNSKSKKLTFGAMMIALFSILLVITTYVPIVNLVTFIFAVLPIAWYSATYDRSSSIFVALVGCILTFLVGGVATIPLSLTFVVLGVVLGDAIRTKKSKLYLFMSSSIALLLVVAVLYVVSIRFLGIDIVRESIELSKESYTESISIAEKMTGQTPITEKDLAGMFEMLEFIIPALVTLSVFLLTFVIISTNLPLLKRFGLNVPKFALFKDMRMPRSILWYYLIILSISLFISPEVGTTLYIIVLNMSVVLWVLFVMQGISFLFFYIHEKGLPNMLKVIVVLLSIPLYSFIMLIGILDLGFNIRGYVIGKNKK